MRAARTPGGTLVLWFYELLLAASRIVLPVAAWRHPKLRALIEGRRGVLERLEAHAPELRGRLVWIHSTSVGEYEQARPVAALLRRARPDLEILHTFSSPSGYEYARRIAEAPFFEYLPWDHRRDVERALHLLQPRLLVFVKFDLWPRLVLEAARRRIPVLLVDATLQPRSLRSRWPARRLYADLYRRLRVISCVSDGDARRFQREAPGHPAICIDGDTRFDQVLRRRADAAHVPIPEILHRQPRPFTLLAGSTWGPDETCLLCAWQRWKPTWPHAARLVLVPHEPTTTHLQALERRLQALGLESVRYAAVESRQHLPEVIVVDRVGILPELYACADVAYVGGAFGRGVHNLIEPAIMAMPVLFGPKHHNAPEADMLLEANAAAVIRSPTDLERQLHVLATDGESRRRMGGQARAFVDRNLGASERCLQHLLAALEGRAEGVPEPP